MNGEPLSGAWNMAMDRALHLSHAEGHSPPTIRLYGWARPAVTIGRFQEESSVSLEVCAAEGVDVARRPTGGRGVLHDDEVTYAIIAGRKDGVPYGTRASYCALSQGLVQAYRKLGVEATLTDRPRGQRRSAACYLSATGADVSLGHRKLSGSAQVWHCDSVLQHGSIVLSRNTQREARAFNLNARDVETIAETTATLDELIRPLPAAAEVCGVLGAAMSNTLDVALTPGGITRLEYERALELLEDAHILGPLEPGPSEGSFKLR